MSEQASAELLEGAQKGRLLEDSDSGSDLPDEAVRGLRLRPTAILHEIPKAKRRAEGVGSRLQFSGLVVVKKKKKEAEHAGTQGSQAPHLRSPESREAADPAPQPSSGGTTLIILNLVFQVHHQLSVHRASEKMRIKN